MGNYEALQKAEEERRRKVAGDQAAPVAALDWDRTPHTAPSRPADKLGFFKRIFSRRSDVGRPAQGSSELNKRRISILRPDSYVSEQFRTLRGRIDAMSVNRPIRTICLSSANPGEGKSTAAINLAVVTSMSVDHKVLIVDCDMRRPTVSQSLGITPEKGLVEVLLGRATLDEAIAKVEGTNLDALLVRLQPENPSELLASREMVKLVQQLSQRYDRVILDTPATLGLPDSKVVTDLCDGIVVVVRASRTPREEVDLVLEILDRNKVLGMVLNDAESERESYGYY